MVQLHDSWRLSKSQKTLCVRYTENSKRRRYLLIEGKEQIKFKKKTKIKFVQDHTMAQKLQVTSIFQIC